MAQADDSGITVETAETPAPETVIATAVADPGDVESIDAGELAAADAPVVADAPATVAAAIDQLEPPVADETPAQQTERRTRIEAAADILEPPVAGETEAQRIERYARVSTDAKAFFSDSPANKRVMIALSKAKAAEQRATKAETDLKTARDAARTPAPAAATPPATTVDELPAPHIPPFDFPEYDAWGELPGNENRTHRDYSVELADARHDWRTEKTRIEKAHTETTRRQTEWDTHQQAVRDQRTARVEAHKAKDPEYDAVMKTAMDLPITPAVQTALDDLGDAGPAVAKHLAQHRDDYAAILTLPPSRQAAKVLAIADDILKAPPAPTPAADAAVDTPPAPARPAIPRAAAPSRPLSDAPSPGSVVSGGAQPTRSLQSIADADEDADEYIVHRAPKSAVAARIRR